VFEKRVSAACACRRIHPDVVDALSQERMQPTFDKTEDLSLGYLIVLVTRMPELMKYISPALKVRLSAFIKKLPENSLSVLNFASDLPFLEKDVCERLSEVTSYQLREFTQRAARKPSRMVIDRAISLLEESKSWDSSNAVAS